VESDYDLLLSRWGLLPHNLSVYRRVYAPTERFGCECEGLEFVALVSITALDPDLETMDQLHEHSPAEPLRTAMTRFNEATNGSRMNLRWEFKSKSCRIINPSSKEPEAPETIT